MTELKRFRIFLVCIFILISSSSIYNVFANDEIVNVSNTEGRSIRHQILLDENLIYFVWEDHTFEKPDVFFSKSTDGGKTFGEVLNLSNNTGSSLWPRFDVSGNDVYVTWYDYTPGISDVFLSHSNDGGLTFQTINLSENIGVSFNSWISASGDSVYVVWMDETPNHIPISIEKPFEEIDVYLGGTDVLLAISHDRGKTFEITNLSKNTVESSAPRLAVLENNLYVAWIQATQSGNQVFFTKSNDGGLTFSSPISVSNGINSINIGVLVNENNIFVTWIGEVEKQSDIFLAKSNDGGNSFASPINISNSSENSSKTRDTHMAFSGNNLYLVWTEKTKEQSDVYFVKSEDGGQRFSQPTNLSYPQKTPSFAEVVTNGNDVYVMWDDVSTSEVFLRTSSDAGKTFASVKNLSNDDAKSTLWILGPHFAATDKGVYAGWSSDGEETKDTLLKFILNEPETGSMILETDNNSVNIKLEITQVENEFQTQTTFNLQFINPQTQQLLENVNYSFFIQDATGILVFSNLDQLAETGQDSQVVNFQQTGYVNLIINVTGIGQTLPYDSTYSGFSSAVITIIPEFSFGILTLLVLAIVMSVIIIKIPHTLNFK